MSRPVFVVDAGVATTATLRGILTLDGPEGRHAATVRRIGVGEQVDLVDGEGTRLTGEVVSASRADLDIRVDAIERQADPAPRFVLVQALAKGDRDDRAIEAATELGVDVVVPWQAQRSIVQWRGDRGAKARQRWVDTVRAAGKQSRRARFPLVADVVELRGLVALAGDAGAAYVLHEEATEPLVAEHLPSQGDVVLVVGPEGGITPAELEALTAAGAKVVRLGPTVLRSSSAGPAALAVLSAAARWR
ncbi:MAG: 16S rRNA (uracil(1498)-N(3))-methyltransferase [Nostocoides sp.]